MNIRYLAIISAATVALATGTVAVTTTANALPAGAAAKTVQNGLAVEPGFQLARAGLATPGIHRRIHNQQRRIRRGVISGRLSRRETRIVRSGLHRVRRALRRARADGFVTRPERIRIHRMLDRNSHRIARFADNGWGGRFRG
jgi:hypothetical protein